LFIPIEKSEIRLLNQKKRENEPKIQICDVLTMWAKSGLGQFGELLDSIDVSEHSFF